MGNFGQPTPPPSCPAMRLYNPYQCTLVATPLAKKQFTPKSFLPTPGASLSPMRASRQPTSLSRAKPLRASFDSACGQSRETASTASTKSYEDFQPRFASPLLPKSSTFRQQCQSPVPQMSTCSRLMVHQAGGTSGAPNEKYASPKLFTEFHFDIDSEKEASDSPFGATSSIYSIDNPPPSFDIEMDMQSISEAINDGTLDASMFKVAAQKDHSTCSSPTLSSRSSSTCFKNYHGVKTGSPVFSPPVKKNGLSASYISELSPSLKKACQSERRQSSSSDSWRGNESMTDMRASPELDVSIQEDSLRSQGMMEPDSAWAAFPEQYAVQESSGDAHSPVLLTQPTDETSDNMPHSLGCHAVCQATSFESSFNCVKEGESIVIMIHRKDPANGMSSMRSFFRDERGRWSKFESA
ncbi:hypothetical protein MPSEU_000435000 [Mayamaea pseudoterrestris]|nr:hypothetical protein MPSEU_000435000 [Mayamaea pseudoterrestris]